MIPDDWEGKDSKRGKRLDRDFWDSDDMVHFMVKVNSMSCYSNEKGKFCFWSQD